MPLKNLEIKPGIYGESSQADAEGRWFDASRVRFRSGKPELFKGWQRLTTTAVVGVPRGMHSWTGPDGITYTVLGTSKKLYLIQGSQPINITPIRKTSNLTDPLTTTLDSQVVNINDTGHGASVGDYIVFFTAVTYNGVTLEGEYTVNNVVDSDNYEITAETAATASGTGGGTFDIDYEINLREDIGLDGYGGEEYSEDEYGTDTINSVPITFWSLDNWGGNLVAAPTQGALYEWSPSANGYGIDINKTYRAEVVPNAPSQIASILVDDENRHLIAFGTNISGTYQPNSIAWCKQQDLTNWTPSATSTAGSTLIYQEGAILGASKTQRQIVILGSTSVYIMEYEGPPFIYNIQFLSDSAGLLSQQSFTEYDGVVYWIGYNNFYAFDGRPKVIPSTLIHRVFNDLDENFKDKTVAGFNPEYGEIIWFYVSINSPNEECDKYVAYNTQENVWYGGELARSAWVGMRTSIPSEEGKPVGAGSDGYVYLHELDDKFDAAGDTLNGYIESGDIDLGDGEQLMFVNRFVPKFKVTKDCYITLTFLDYPFSDGVERGPYRVTPTTKFVDTRGRGRAVRVKIESGSVGSYFRFGDIAVDMQSDGER